MTRVITAAFFSCILAVSVQAEPAEGNGKNKARPEFFVQNERCFRCHGESKYTWHNTVSNTDVAAMMSENRIIGRNDFYAANHRSFACTDCHSAEYDSFPHPGALRMETIFNCIDCHGNDKKFAKYHFEEIEAEFHQSTHYIANGEPFTCWKCHDPHSYKISIRDSKNITQSIAYDNRICLNCHSDSRRLQLFTNHKDTDILKKHEWLPNRDLHFSRVRCIECHAITHDSILVAHRILPKEKAVKRCVECHSRNSILLGTLYKYRIKENRIRAGFANTVILNNAFVIGANRNIWLNKASIAIFLITFILLSIHFIMFRIHRKRN